LKEKLSPGVEKFSILEYILLEAIDLEFKIIMLMELKNWILDN